MTRAAAFARIPVGLAGDASGNIGLGVTPNAWYTGSKALQIGTLGLEGRVSGSYSNIFTNAYISADGSNYIYVSSNYATSYKQNSGAHSWSTAPSGTAGGAISFTQAMTLDASGNLGVGTTSPAQNGGGGSKVLHVNATGASDWSTLHLTNGTTGAAAGDGFVLGLIGDGNAQLFNYENTAMVFSTNATERARIDSSGNLLVGATATDSGAKARIAFGASQNGLQLKDSNDTSGAAFLIFQNGSNSNFATISRDGTNNSLKLSGVSAITFPATQVASSNANTLDDYEEGTFSPTIDGWSGTYSAQFGVYTKVGNLVYCFGRVTTSGGTGTFTNTYPGLASFPFAAGPAGAAAKGMWFVVSGSTGLSSSQTASGPLDGPGNGSTSAFPNWIITGGNVSNWTSGQLSAAGNVEYRFFCTYTST